MVIGYMSKNIVYDMNELHQTSSKCLELSLTDNVILHSYDSYNVSGIHNSEDTHKNMGMLSVRTTSQDNGVSNSRTIDLSSPLCSVHWIPTANAFSSLGPVTLD